MTIRRVLHMEGISAIIWLLGALTTLMMIPAGPAFVELWIFGIVLWFILIGLWRYGLLSIIAVVIPFVFFQKIEGTLEYLTGIAGMLVLLVAVVKAADFARRYRPSHGKRSIDLLPPLSIEYTCQILTRRILQPARFMLALNLWAALVFYGITLLAPGLARGLTPAFQVGVWVFIGSSVLDFLASIVFMCLYPVSLIIRPPTWILLGVTGMVTLLFWVLPDLAAERGLAGIHAFSALHAL